MLLPLAAFAGENVQLLDANGKPLKPSQIDSVSIQKSCGDCHDVASNAKTVHFNRKSGGADPESSSCLSCHVSKKSGAFNADGTVKKMTTKPEDAGCISCHAEMEKCSGAGAHASMTCYDCHQGAGHKSAATASCQGCHNGKTNAPKPVHNGIPALHMKDLACESCHVPHTADTGAEPGHARISGKIVPVNESGAAVHHVVCSAKDALGTRGCTDCHSSSSKFFLGTTSVAGKDGNTKNVPGWKAMGLKKHDLLLGELREKLLKPYAIWIFVLVVIASIGHYVVFGPHKVKVPQNDGKIERFTIFERFIHLLAISTCLFLAITGILFMLHKESAMGSLRSIHGHVGVLFAVSILGMLAIWWKNGLFVSCDKDWVCKMGGYLWMKGDCPAEKFNAGQKMYYWGVVIACGFVIAGTGLIMLAAKGHAGALIYTLHDLAAVVMIASVMGHVYLSVFANPGTITAIITGRVPRAWAKHHHPNWYERHHK